MIVRRIALTLMIAVAPVLPIRATAKDGNWCDRNRPHPIDVALADAIDRSGGVTVEMRDAQSAAFDAWDRQLTRSYAAMHNLVNGSQRDALQTAQRAWLDFDAAQARWDWSMHSSESSSAPLNVSDAAVQRRRARACELERDLDSLREE